jgi:polysaccharide biosynthesis protein PelA
MKHDIIPYFITAFVLGFAIIASILIIPAHAQDSEKYAESAGQKKFVIYYGSEQPDHEFTMYDIVVFDRENHPQLSKLKARNKVVLGYISGGELDEDISNFAELKDDFKLLKENEDWEGSHIVDIRDPKWTAYIIQDLIPDILRKGFSGIFIDTIDSAEYLEQQDPVKYAGMINAAVNMVKTIRMHYPNIKIMLNRGYEVLPKIARDIDYVLAEGTLANYNFETNKSTLFSEEIYQEYVQKHAELKQIAPHLQIMTTDYWDMNDLEGVKNIYQKHRENGYIPYVTTIDLNNVHHQPW